MNFLLHKLNANIYKYYNQTFYLMKKKKIEKYFTYFFVPRYQSDIHYYHILFLLMSIILYSKAIILQRKQKRKRLQIQINMIFKLGSIMYGVNY